MRFTMYLAAELVSMNETFVKARTLFDRMMEESLARHSGRKCLVLYFEDVYKLAASSL